MTKQAICRIEVRRAGNQADNGPVEGDLAYHARLASRLSFHTADRIELQQIAAYATTGLDQMLFRAVNALVLTGINKVDRQPGLQHHAGPFREDAHHRLYDLASAHHHYNRYRTMAGLRHLTGANGGGAQPAAGPGGVAGGVNGNLTGPQAADPRRAAALQSGRRAVNGRNLAARAAGDDGPNPFGGNAEWWKEDLPQQ